MNMNLTKAEILRVLVDAGLKDKTALDDLPAIAHVLAAAGYRKQEDLSRLRGKAMIMDQDDPQADPFMVYGFDGFGHSVKLEQTGHHAAAALERQITKYGEGRTAVIGGLEKIATARYDPIWLCQVLAVHGDGTMFWAESI